MKNFYTTLLKPFTTGLLSTTAIYDKHADGLITCTDLYPHPTGLHGHRPLIDMFNGSLPESSSWPYPQLFRGSAVTLLAYEKSVYQITNDMLPPATTQEWLEAKLSLRNYKDVTVEYSLADSDEPWHFVDFGIVWFLIRPTDIVFRLRTEGLFQDHNSTLAHGTDYVMCCSDITMYTGCAHRGRMITGGFDSSQMYSQAAWSQIWNAYYPNTPEPLETFNNLASIDQNYVMWSSIGGGDIAYLFFPMLALQGLLSGYVGDADRPPFFDHLKRNEMGFMPMNWRGPVYCVKSLGKDVIVYGKDGITRLYQVSAPAPTFGRQDLLLGEGIDSRGAVAGDDLEHVVMLASGNMLRIQEGGKMTPLEYSIHTSAYVSDVVASLDATPGKRRYFFATGSLASKVLTPDGLYSSDTQLHVTSVALFNGKVVGIFDADDSSSTGFTTAILDFGNRGVKTLTKIELGIDVSADVTAQVKVYWRIDADTAFGQTAFINANASGVVYPNQSGTDFYITVQLSKGGAIEPYINTVVKYMKIYYEQSDKRSIGGYNVS